MISLRSPSVFFCRDVDLDFRVAFYDRIYGLAVLLIGLVTPVSHLRLHVFLSSLSIRPVVLRDVLRPQRGDAQAVGDVQANGRHHQAGPAIPIQRGELFPHSVRVFSRSMFFSSRLQHQTQVAMTVDRAKQITMAELNAVMQVRRPTKHNACNDRPLLSYKAPRESIRLARFLCR